ncbi:folylpolyglutamate synthase/dihydrofolate synthase family protein [Conexibacter sp. SYSU D00693]|uniref:bifunctional folylpolyglutamate synthase/dihydrofolate synthase n=1 Tax=Conexibacter sp. SYSU D00693 TaxID=2812560 RepID=UPI00196B0B1D|nr:cyanophycin synthetase [Conexibacter sp. SYSU D00693]
MGGAPAMSYPEAERALLDLELFGMRFGLDRMRRLLTVLGSPQERFRAIHVVGSNGKSSTTRLAAAILRRHGLRTGAYLSPHLVAFRERVRVDDEDVSEAAFADAVARVLAAAEKVDRTNGPDDRVTQFEAVTAAGLLLLAEAEVQVAVVEAGLGGRFDATNVLPTSVAVCTNVGLEHTRWLGPTIRDVASEKLAVVRDGSTLVVGHGLHPDALEVAERVCRERRARLVQAPEDVGVELVAQGAFQRRNFATAHAAVGALLGELDDAAVRAAAAATLVPGRFEEVDHDPITIVDGAHNPAGVEALADSLPSFLAGRRLVAVVSVLDDKDAATMLATLAPLCDHIVCTSNANPRTLSPATLLTECERLGVAASIEPDPRRALERARELAGPGGVALATGSLYLLADLRRPATHRDQRASRL